MKIKRIILLVIAFAANLGFVNANIEESSKDGNHFNPHKSEKPVITSSYDEDSKTISIVFENETSETEVSIYKDGEIVEQENKQNVEAGHTESYSLSEYGAGVYDVYAGADGEKELVETVIVAE